MRFARGDVMPLDIIVLGPFQDRPACELSSIAQRVRDRMTAVGAKTAYIEPGSPWENGYYESLNAGSRSQLLNGEIFYSLPEAEIMVEQWRIHYSTVTPDSSLGYRPPAPEIIVPIDHRPTVHQ